MSDFVSVKLIITGKVQGVGYRAWSKYEARKLGITGFIRNTPEGNVEAVFQGDEQTVSKIIELCKKGPWLAKVDKVEVIKDDIKEKYIDFKVLK